MTPLPVLAWQILFAVGPGASRDVRLPLLRGNAAVLKRALTESGADQVPAGPSSTAYAEAWAEAIERWLGRVFGGRGDVWSGFALGMEILVLILVAAALGLLSLALWRLVQRRRRAELLADREIFEAPPREPVTFWSAEEWRRQLDRRLSSGDLAGALEALWWWVARCLGDSDVDASWTSRQLLTTFRREDLAADVGKLDRMIYGAKRPGAEEIRGLFSRLAESVR